MAHQFPSTPTYGAGYPPLPFYPFTSNPPQAMSANHPIQQQSSVSRSNPHTPTPLPNNMRYDANAQINSQPAPFSFPPNLNPEMFKHFPPPPPPPANFSTGSGTPTSFAHFSHALNSVSQHFPQQNFPLYPQPQLPIDETSTRTQGIPTVPSAITHNVHGQIHDPSDSRSVREAGKHGDYANYRNLALDGPSQEQRSAFSDVRLFDAHLDGSRQQYPSGTKPSVNEQHTHGIDHADTRVIPPQLSSHTIITSQTRASPPLVTSQAQPGNASSQPELKDQAKAAISSLQPYNITYRDLLAEGVSPHVLQQLFSELGLNWKTAEGSSSIATSTILGKGPNTIDSASQIATSIHVPTSTTANTSAKLSSGVPVPARPQSAVNPGLERKDRIAQLLAAKAGKTNATATTSKSGSPNPVVELTPPRSTATDNTNVPRTSNTPESSQPKPFKTLAQTELVRQKMEKLRQEAAERARTQSQPQADQLKGGSAHVVAAMPVDVTPSALASIPTLVKEPPQRNGLSSMIPGLFMTSADDESDHEVPNSLVRAPINVDTVPSQQKATVADRSQFLYSATKRSAENQFPQGEQREAKRLSLSKDKPADVEMNLDGSDGDNASEGEIVEDGESQAQIQATSHATPESDQFQKVILPAQDHSSARVSAPTSFYTESILAQAPHELTTPEGSYSKQSELDSMRKRIAEIEQRKSEKRNQSLVSSPFNSNSGTPVPTPGPGVHGSSPTSRDPDFEQGVGASPRPRAKMSSAQLAERAAQLKADYIRQRDLRQKQIVDGMPALDDEIDKTKEQLQQARAKLHLLQLEIQRCERELANAKEKEQHVHHDIKYLEQQLQDGVSGQKKYSNELKEIKQQADDEKASRHQKQAGATALVTTVNSAGVTPIDATSLSSHLLDREHSLDSAVHTERHDLTQDVLDKVEPHRVTDSSTSISQSVQVPLSLTPIQDVSMEILSSPAPEGVVTSVPKSNEEYEDDSDDEPMDQSEDESDDTHMSVDQESDGSASMSDSGSEDYEPAVSEINQGGDHQTEDSEGYEPEGAVESLDNTPPETASDDYEPSETIETVTVEDIQSIPQADKSSIHRNVQSQTIDGHSKHHEDLDMVSNAVPITTGDDQENGLQLTEADTLTKPQENIEILDTQHRTLSGGESSLFTRFVPYQSPLSSFKSYRFHPSFHEQVKNGYRSLTYSNKIDPSVPICPHELAGNSCPDPECEEQHFGTMALSDDKILVQMSSAHDIKDKGLRDQYLLGLKQVIARLRQEGVKEFSLVADALSKHRRDWTASQTGA